MRISEADLNNNNNVKYYNIFAASYVKSKTRTIKTIEWLKKTPFVIIEHTENPPKVSLITHSLVCRPSAVRTHLEGGILSDKILEEPIDAPLYIQTIGGRVSERENAIKFLEGLTIDGGKYLDGEAFKRNKNFSVGDWRGETYSVSKLLLDIKLNTARHCIDAESCAISFKPEVLNRVVPAQQDAFKQLVELMNKCRFSVDIISVPQTFKYTIGEKKDSCELVIRMQHLFLYINTKEELKLPVSDINFIRERQQGNIFEFTTKESHNYKFKVKGPRKGISELLRKAMEQDPAAAAAEAKAKAAADGPPPLFPLYPKPPTSIRGLFNESNLPFFGEGGFANKSQIRDLLNEQPTDIDTWKKIEDDEKDGGLLLPKEIDPDNFVVDRKKKLGSGNFGDVYKGYCNNVGCTTSIEASSVNSTPLAIKILSGEETDDSFLEFIKEATIMAQYGKHPNLVELLGVKTKKINRSHELEMILEFCEHGDLESCLEDGRVEGWKRRKENLTIVGVLPSNLDLDIKFATDIATGMKFLAEKKIVHRDLAARNVLVGEEKKEEYVCKIADFGMSVLIEKDKVSWNWKGGLFPLAWMQPWNPELNESHKAFSEQTDIWSFGCVLIEILTNGTQPWSACYKEGESSDLPKHEPKKCTEITLTNEGLMKISWFPGLVDDYLKNLCHFIISIKKSATLEKSEKELISVIKKCWAEEEKEEKTFSKILKYISGGNIEIEECTETPVWNTHVPDKKPRWTGPNLDVATHQPTLDPEGDPYRHPYKL